MSDTRPSAGDTGSVRQLHYEGFPLEAVLARVHAAHGADVTITGADRVRRGGIGGFFARELFQVTVTVPVPGATSAEADEPLNFVPLGRISIFDDTPVVLGPEADEDIRDYDDIDPEDIAGALTLEPAPTRDDADAEIWALLAAAATAAPTRPQPPVEPSEAAVPQAALPSVVLPEVLLPEATPTDSVLPAAVAAGLAASLVGSPTVPVVAEVVAPIVAAGPIASTTLIPASSVIGTPFDPALSSPCSPGLPIATVLPASPEATPARVDLDALIARFETAPPAPSLPAAGIVAVIGTRVEALEVAGRLARCLGIPTDDVIVASPPADVVVPTPDEAMRLAATTRYRCAPVAVIVLELVPGRQGHEWVRVILDGLRAEQVRLAADAGRLVAHQHLSIGAVGGVDVIDLLGASEHHDPTEALRLSTPVGTIDGRPASPELWAATVLAGAAVPLADGRPLRRDRSVVS